MPAVLIQKHNRVCGNIQQIRDEPERFRLAVLFVGNDHFAKLDGGDAFSLGAVGGEVANAIAEHAGGTVFFRQRSLRRFTQRR